MEVTHRTYAWSGMDTIMIGGGGDFHDWYVAAIGTGTGILHHGGGTLWWSIMFGPVCDQRNARAIQYR